MRIAGVRKIQLQQFPSSPIDIFLHVFVPVKGILVVAFPHHFAGSSLLHMRTFLFSQLRRACTCLFPLRIPGMISIQSLVFLTRGNLSLPNPVRPHQPFPLYSSSPPSPQRPPTIPNHTSPLDYPPPRTRSRSDSSRPECP